MVVVICRIENLYVPKTRLFTAFRYKPSHIYRDLMRLCCSIVFIFKTFPSLHLNEIIYDLSACFILIWWMEGTVLTTVDSLLFFEFQVSLVQMNQEFKCPMKYKFLWSCIQTLAKPQSRKIGTHDNKLIHSIFKCIAPICLQKAVVQTNRNYLMLQLEIFSG